MENPYNKSSCIRKAGDLVMAKRLDKLYALCNQKTVSTRKLARLLDELADGMRLDAIFIREVSRRLPD